MNRNLKLALAALLGFSAACTSVKNAPKEDTAKTQGADTTAVKGYPEFPRRVVVMYGVRPPHPVQSVPRQDGGSAAPADSAAVSAVPAESAESVESAAGGR